VQSRTHGYQTEEMAIRIVLAGDTMLGRGVAELLRDDPARPLWAPQVRAFIAEADLAVLNLECCISERGERWPDPAKPFFFRAPPVAAERLADLGVDCVTLANNHALDYGAAALLDTLHHLDRAGIGAVGAGADLARARGPAILVADGQRVGVIGVADHPLDFAAAERGPGIAYEPLSASLPEWLADAIAGLDVDVTLVTPHWGPNMVPSPIPQVRAAAQAFVAAGATVVAGHSAHVFHGVEWAGEGQMVLYDLGDFIDDYAVHPTLRNDHGILWAVEVEAGAPVAVDALPLRLEYGFTRVAEEDEADWIRRRLGQACAEFGTTVSERDGRLVAARG
jgi:poly-gamma-glutamate capsule biosynthesis protein CapA/YwtB (metallophosphatase superfamily)